MNNLNIKINNDDISEALLNMKPPPYTRNIFLLIYIYPYKYINNIMLNYPLE